MKLIRTCLIALTVLLAILTVACGNSKKPIAYDYNLSEYVQLGEYKGISYNETKPTEITEDVIVDEIQYQIQNKNLMISENITDRPAKLTDTVNIDYVGKIDGVAFEGGTSSGYDLKLGSHTFIDGYEEGLVGAKVGQEVTLNLTFPENYKNDDLAGKDVVFEVKVNSITSNEFPEFNDELATKLSDYTTFAQYKEYVKSYLESEAKESVKTANETAVWDVVFANSKTLKYPGKEYKVYYDNMYTYLESIATDQQMTMEEYAKACGVSMKEVTSECDKYAKATVDTFIIAAAIYKDAKLKITDEQYDSYLSTILSHYGSSTVDEALEIVGEKWVIDSQIIYLYVTDYLLENAVAA